jgi:hypothetical protein
MLLIVLFSHLDRAALTVVVDTHWLRLPHRYHPIMDIPRHRSISHSMCHCNINNSSSNNNIVTV